MGKSTRICSYDGCDKFAKTRSLCNGHYEQRRRGRGLAPLKMRSLTLKQRFWAKVNKAAPGGCWMWTAVTDSGGYGRINVDGRMRKAHRVSWEFAHGPIPDGLMIDHRCVNRCCVNPEHLRVVTNAQNMQHLTGAYKNGASGVRGVSWNKRRGAWVAYASLNGRSYFGGYHSTIEAADEAARALRAQLHTHDDHDEWLRRNGRSA